MRFAVRQKVLFKHCDPAGIVFYPRIFEMVNDCVEAFFSDVLLVPFEELHQSAAVPTVAIETKFTAPSRHGDVLNIGVTPTRIGRSSLALTVEAHCGDEVRFVANPVLVYVGLDGKPMPWPEFIRDKIEEMLEVKI